MLCRAPKAASKELSHISNSRKSVSTPYFSLYLGGGGRVWWQPHSHVALAQGSVDGQQAGDLLDDDLPRQLDGPAAVVTALALGLEPPGFLGDGSSEGRGRERPRQRRNRATA